MKDNLDISQSLLSTAGENYEYVRTIINNKLEIKKLELISKTGSIASSLFLIISIIIIAVLISQVLLALTAFALYVWLGSWIYAFIIIIGVLTFLAATIYLIRKPILQKILERKILQNIDLKD